MTAATTILALLPVLTSTGRGADIMIPVAIPSFGGMYVELQSSGNGDSVAQSGVPTLPAARVGAARKRGSRAARQRGLHARRRATPVPLLALTGCPALPAIARNAEVETARAHFDATLNFLSSGAHDYVRRARALLWRPGIEAQTSTSECRNGLIGSRASGSAEPLLQFHSHVPGTSGAVNRQERRDGGRDA